MYRFFVVFFVLASIFLASPVATMAAEASAPASDSASDSAWAPAGTLYLDGHVHACFRDYKSTGARMPHVREMLRQGLLMEAYRSLGLIPREEWLGDAFPSSETDWFSFACRLDAKHKSSNQAEEYSKKRCQSTVRLMRETLQDSKDRDIDICYYLGYRMEKDPETGKPILPTAVRETGRLLQKATIELAPFDIAFSTSAVDQFIHEKMFPALEKELKKEKGFKPAPLKQSDAGVPESILTLLQDMNFIAQFSAIRQLHALEQEQGQSPQIMAALARGYANLSVLTNDYWNPIHNAFAGRAMWYAENLPQEGIVKVEETPEASEEADSPAETMPATLWRDLHCFYVYGILGYHAEALAIEDKLKEEHASLEKASRPALPPWVPLIDAYCHYDIRKLQGDQVPQAERELAGVLELFCVDEGNCTKDCMSCSSRTCERLSTSMPDCYRLYGTSWYGGLTGMRHKATVPAATLPKDLYQRIAQVPNVPKPILAIAEKRLNAETGNALTQLFMGRQNDSKGEFSDRQRLYRSLLGTVSDATQDADEDAAEDSGKGEAASESFLAEDRNPLSWSALGLIIRELSFRQVQFQVMFPSRAYGIPLSYRELEALKALYEDHSCAAYFEVRADRDLRIRRQLVIDLMETWPSDCVLNAGKDLRHVPRRYREMQPGMYNYCYFFSKAIPQDSRFAAIQVSCANTNLCARGFSLSLQRVDREFQPKMAKVFLQIVPSSPLARFYLAWYCWDTYKEQAETWKDEGYGFPGLLAQLGQRYLDRDENEKAIECFKMANAESPNFKVALKLAWFYYQQEDYENWQKTLEDFLKNPGAGLNYARANEKLAYGFMERRQWETALPYAKKAAESYSGWGLLCAAACCEALEDWETAEQLCEACAKRYRGSRGVWMNYCLRTGKGDFEGAKQLMEQEVARHQQGNPHSINYCDVCLSYYFEHDRDLYLRYLQDFHTPWSYMLQFAAYLEKGDTQKRDRALKAALDPDDRIDASSKNEMPRLNEMVKLFHEDVEKGCKAQFDEEKVDHIFATGTEQERVNILYLLGCYYDACGKPKEAIRAWKRCLASVRMDSMRRTQSALELRKRNVSLDDMDDIAEELAKDEVRWKASRRKDKNKEKEKEEDKEA